MQKSGESRNVAVHSGAFVVSRAAETSNTTRITAAVGDDHIAERPAD
ncbi:hypothetical protein [Streptomyces sp. NPDC048644]